MNSGPVRALHPQGPRVQTQRPIVRVGRGGQEEAIAGGMARVGGAVGGGSKGERIVRSKGE